MSVPDQQIRAKGDRLNLRRIRRQLRKENAYVHLLRVVSSVSNEATTIEEPLQTALDAICALTGWPVGHALLKADERDEIVSAGLWHLVGPERFETFRKVSEAITFGSGFGLPGRVLAGGAPAWIPDITRDTNFPRNRLAQDLGLRAAFAFPILVGKEVTGVLEFFHTEKLAPDGAILMVMNQVGVQLGRVFERRRAELTLTRLAEGISAKEGGRFFASLVGHLAKSVMADYALIGEVRQGSDAVRTLGVCARGDIVPNFQYDLAGTPCEKVVDRHLCSYRQDVHAKFPQDRLLGDMQAQGYVGTPLFDSAGRVQGLLAALWCRPPANMRVAESMVQIFAVRAAAELERKRALEEARKLAEVPRVNPHPVLEFSGDGSLRFCNTAAHVLARSVGKDDPIHILPTDTAGIVRKCLETGKNGVVVDTLADERTIVWSFIPIVRNDSVFAHAFELTLLLSLRDEMRRVGGLLHGPVSRPAAGSGRIVRPRPGKERVH